MMPVDYTAIQILKSPILTRVLLMAKMKVLYL